MATRLPSATSRSGCCRERPRQTVGDDVLAVLHLGRLVHDDRRVHDPPRDGDADALALYGEPHRGHRRAVLPGSRRRPLLRDREGARRAPSAGRPRDARRAPRRGRPRHVHPPAAVLQPVLHADARPREQSCVPPHPVAGEAVSSDPRVRHRRLDRGGAVHQPRAGRPGGGRPGTDGAAALHRRRSEHAARPLQLHPAPYASPRRGATRLAAQHRRPRRAGAARRPCILRLHCRLAPVVHPAGGLLQLHPDLSGRRRHQKDRGDAVAGTDVRGRLHAAHAALLRAAGREADADGRHGSVGPALRPVCDRGPRRGLLAHHHRYPAPRCLLRLLLRDRPDLRGQEIHTRGARPGAGIPRAGHLRHRHAHRRTGSRQRVQPAARRRGRSDPRALAQLLGAARGVCRRGPGLFRAAVPAPRQRPRSRAGTGEGIMTTIPRRQFVGSVAAAAAFTIVPRHVLGRGYRAPSDKLNVACVGVGGMGRTDVKGMEGENIYALCDVDGKAAEDAFQSYPKAKRYRDYREMLDKESKNIDAVTISTPDHSHTAAGLLAMNAGKHTYIQKPLARTMGEVRVLGEYARAHPKLMTQMGNQGHAREGTRLIREWVEAGAVGTVREVHFWTNRPIWPQAIDRPLEEYYVPATLDWNLWLGPAPERPYHPAYVPFKWRGFWDFGTGALGDMACHIMDAAYWALDLGLPTRIEPESTPLFKETAPAGSRITYTFRAKGARPELRAVWHDGSLYPPRPPEVTDDAAWPFDRGGGQLWIGTDGKLVAGTYGDDPKVLDPAKQADLVAHPPAQKYPRSPGVYPEWIAACKGGAPAGSTFRSEERR